PGRDGVGEDARRVASPAPEAGGGLRAAGQAERRDAHHVLARAAGSADRRAVREHRAAELLRPARAARRGSRHAAPGGDPATEEGAGRGDGLARLTGRPAVLARGAADCAPPDVVQCPVWHRRPRWRWLAAIRTRRTRPLCSRLISWS